ncbi:hypothetical protein GCM10023321_46170 [Pseudonocardia eucalypti]|uniref:Mce/MlaD domain-containing protein n=1 Tax=Pseudonocardia eucalypti TaxID=648755 RepID=A0ABP9QGN1_9PSEU|nr:phospholipid/cholesterol/gamma-HCH transport system substrate-binding protein [Pseudonocardia eucalypti]
MRQIFSGFVGRALALVAFFAFGLAIFSYLYLGIGGYVPFVTPNQYTLAVKMADGDNLVQASRVSIAGVKIGDVRSIEREGNELKATFMVEDRFAPLHQGVRIRLGERSLVGEAYFDVVDGTGAELPSGAMIPSKDFQPSTQLHDVIASFDPKTRADMSSMLRSLGAGTKETHEEVSGMLAGMGGLGRDGATALDAIAAQSEDFTALGRDLSTLMQTLDTGEGRIADLVTSANRLTRATASQRGAVEATMNELPDTLDVARTASSDVKDLSRALRPVVSDLKDAAPFLSDALDDLPEISDDLRKAMPPLSKVMDRADGTFDRIPRFQEKSADTIPEAREFLRDLNPLLKYLKPYGPEIGGFFGNLNASWQYTNGNGLNHVRVFAMLNDRALGNTPVAYKGPLTYSNPYPKPGSQPRPGPWDGKYPRVERLPK